MLPSASSLSTRARRALIATAVAAMAATGLAVVPGTASAATSDWLDSGYKSFTKTNVTYAGVDSDSAGNTLVFTSPETGSTSTLTRLAADGSPDTTFGTDGAVAIDDAVSGGVYASGTGAMVLTTSATDVVKLRHYTAAGVLDTAFGGTGTVTLPAGTGTLDTVDLGVRADGTSLVLVTRATETAEDVTFASKVYSYTATGEATPGWGTAGAVPANGEGVDLTVNGNNTLVLGYDNDGYETFTALDATGKAATFKPAIGDTFAGFAVQSNGGKYYLSGAKIVGDDFFYQAGVMRLNGNGTIDTTYGSKGIAALPARGPEGTASEIQFASDGTAYVISDNYAEVSPLYVSRLNANGAVDTSFGTGGTLLIDSLGGRKTVYGYGTAAGTGLVVAGITQTGSDDDPTYNLTTTKIKATATQTPGTFQSLNPTRVLDTRKGVGAPAKAVAANGTVALKVAGVGGVPADAGAVVLNVTATGATANAAITVYPAGQPLPTTSNINLPKGRTTPNLVTVKVGTGGVVDLRNGSTGTTQLIADVAGYYRSGTATAAGAYVPLTPARVLDTRKTGGALAPNATRDVQIGGQGGVPADAIAVVANLTAVSPTATGVLTAYPAGIGTPAASNLNFTANSNIANLATVRLSADGKIQLKNGSGGSTHYLVDVAGYYLPGTATVPGTFVSLNPSRVLDTRIGVGAPKAAVKAGQTIPLALAGKGSVPTTGVGAVILNTTVVSPTGDGLVTVYPDGEALPTASNLNYLKGQTVANLVAARTGARTTVDLKVAGAGATQLVADVAGYFRD